MIYRQLLTSVDIISGVYCTKNTVSEKHPVNCPRTNLIAGFHIKREGPNSCSLGYVTHANPRGNLPIWLSNRLSSTFAPKLIRKVHKACLKYPDWKAKQGKKSQLKPWLYPEQISSPRIDVEDVSFRVQPKPLKTSFPINATRKSDSTLQWSPDLTNHSGPSQLFVKPGYSL